ncbi:hypothetical protein K491DRAFT_697596 [Lophiostoma macrostomum CBS 122681]|uniref:Uncharacterized protein n=1 Tax=Lophiostoma macrostomum CBS 122681 TaxID=1314788 RepID=A0A6A6SQZ8_9PLEO|nr:hypothetical protein K491DRAFT_697596 [Lophiostoma macrostomum CBS 122681]
MQFKAALISLLFAGSAIAAGPVIRTAHNAVDACNCPNNCSHHAGSSCAFYDNGNTIHGVCNDVNGGLVCQD